MDDIAVQLKGTVEDIIYRNEENGYTVLDLYTGEELITAVGSLPMLSIGESITVLGRWDRHPSFGKQFKIEKAERAMPKSATDMLKYLSGGSIKGIGAKTAVKIVEKFGDNTFEILENHPMELAKIKGISIDKANEMSKDFKNQFAIREIMIYLEKYDLSPNQCVAIYKLFGARSIDIIEQNPYILCVSSIGISFEKCDEIAKKINLDYDSLYRIKAGIIHVIRYNLNNGHTCLPTEKVIELSSEFLSESTERTQEAMDLLVEEKELVEVVFEEKDFVFLPYLYHAETSAADRLKVMLRFPPPQGKKSISSRIASIEKKFDIEYDDSQKEAITTALSKGMLILTGGPGTGKTTTLNGIIELFERDGLQVSLTAPTGRASKRMSEITGREAKTIHRLLEVEWRDDAEKLSFKRNAANPLTCDCLVVDELSMVDISLFSSLLDALKLGCRLIMVGDSDQLPAVGAGNVLHDLINSHVMPVVSLKKIFRQAMESLIVTNAHRIVSGEYPILDVTDNDFFFMNRLYPHTASETIADLYIKRLPKAYGYDPLNNIQILCPSKKGETGSVYLNQVIQKLVNPPDKDKNEVIYAGRIFREGDRVMQIKNNYDITWVKGKENGTGVYNGDTGILEEIRPSVRMMKIKFDDRTVIFSFDYLNQLDLAYAITVHKSQGSEYDAVIMPVCRVMPNLSYRNLLYTAVTRAKSKLILVGTKEDVYAMIDNDKRIKRYSGLKYFLTKHDD